MLACDDVTNLNYANQSGGRFLLRKKDIFKNIFAYVYIMDFAGKL